jgi:two-component system phosphate regulon sensor histidine kinase PhoR
VEESKPYVALVMQDISRLLRLHRARRDMVANISHELRTPITSIRLLVDSLNRQQIGKKDRTKMLRKVSRELDALQSIVEGMHDLSMIESGQSIMKLRELPLYELVQESIDHLDEQLQLRGLTLEIQVDREFYVLVDHMQIGRVLTNLINNAIKATPKKGTIRVTAKRSLKDETILVQLDDSGPGVAADERERIFERFYQIDEARSQGRGSGLGLSIAKHIIEAHQGNIWVEKSPLGGARFCFTLLSTEPPKHPQEAPQG